MKDLACLTLISTFSAECNWAREHQWTQGTSTIAHELRQNQGQFPKKIVADGEVEAVNLMSYHLGLQRYFFPQYDMYPDTVVTMRYTIRYVT